MSSKSGGSKKQIVTSGKNQAALSKAGAIQVERSLNSLTTLGLEIQRNLAEVGAKLSEKVAELQAVDESIELKKKEMEDLHGADALLMSLDDLRAQHADYMVKFEQETDKARQAYEEEMRQLRERKVRDEAEYDYKLLNSRRADNDSWQEQLRVRNRDEKIRQENFDKLLATKTDELSKMEQSYKDALQKAASFDTELKKAVDRETSIVLNVVKKEYEHKAQLTDITHKAELSGLTTKISSLENDVKSRDAAIDELRLQLKTALEAQTQLAKDAVASAATQKNIADMQSLVTNIGSNGARPRS